MQDSGTKVMITILFYWLWLPRVSAASNTTSRFVVNDFIQAFQSNCGNYLSPIETCPLDISSSSTNTLRRSAASDLSECYVSAYKSYFTCSEPRHPDRGMALLPIHNIGLLPEMSAPSTTPSTRPVDVHGNATCAKFPSLVNVLRASCKFDYDFLAQGFCCNSGENVGACATESFNALACGIQAVRGYVACTTEFSLSDKNVTEHEADIVRCVKDRSERIAWLPIGYQADLRFPLSQKCSGKLNAIALLGSLNAISIALVSLGNWRFWRMLRSKLVSTRRATSMTSKKTGSSNNSAGGSGSRTPEEVVGDQVDRDSFHPNPDSHHQHHHYHSRPLGKIEEEGSSSNESPPATDDIEELAKAEQIQETSKVEDFPSRGNSMRADTRRRRSALMQGKKAKQYTSTSAFKFSFLLLCISLALHVIFTVGIALLFRQNGLNVVIFAQVTAWCLRPRSGFFVGVMGLLDAGWMASGFYTMITDVILTGVGGIMLAISGLYNLYPQNPAKPAASWNIFNVGAVLSLLPTGIFFLAVLYVVASILCVGLKQVNDDEWSEQNPGKLFLVPWYAVKKRARIAWKWLLSSYTRERKVGSLPATRFSSWVKVGYYGLLGCTFLAYIGNWTFWIGFLSLSGPLYCPQHLEIVYIMGFGLTTALTLMRVVFEL